MDKRIIKSREAIYRGFRESLEDVPYERMAIEDILGRSGVSRSTFYKHFRSKDEVLSSISENIFDHVFSHSLSEESTHDFSKTDIFDYAHLMTHILYHLHDEKELITCIIESQCKDKFLNDLRKHLSPISEKVIRSGLVEESHLPFELQRDRLTESFIVTVDYWFRNGCKETPEKLTGYIFETR